MTGDRGYLLDNQQAEAGQRFDALAELFDPVTFRHLSTVGVASGWSCWEVGAGGPSLPAWLAEHLGPSGRVVASDIDTSWLRAGGAYEVVKYDAGSDEALPGPFDLIHARLVLVHLRERAQALASLAGALRPGGWLVVEDADPALQPLICPDEHGPEQRLANRLRHGFRELLAQRGAELAFGRTLPRLLREVGLVDVEADGFSTAATATASVWGPDSSARMNVGTRLPGLESTSNTGAAVTSTPQAGSTATLKSSVTPPSTRSGSG